MIGRIVCKVSDLVSYGHSHPQVVVLHAYGFVFGLEVFNFF